MPIKHKNPTLADARRVLHVSAALLPSRSGPFSEPFAGLAAGATPLLHLLLQQHTRCFFCIQRTGDFQHLLGRNLPDHLAGLGVSDLANRLARGFINLKSQAVRRLDVNQLL
jgi:hypothetical protein